MKLSFPLSICIIRSLSALRYGQIIFLNVKKYLGVTNMFSSINKFKLYEGWPNMSGLT
jgi:hypothetical protein